jgi:glycerol-3-phosphate acyltransferase PlsX
MTQMNIAIDVMGGDHAPAEIIKGALLALNQLEDTHLILVGDETEIIPHLGHNQKRVDIVHANEIIGAEEQPVRAVKRKPDSSLVTCLKLVRDGKADACISAGNTGAYMAAGLLVLGRTVGIDRPALAVLLPTVKAKPVLVLDVGANVDAKPHHLFQYAVMGDIYARHILGINQPQIGLLNVGSEESKGNELVKKTFPLLKGQCANFTGNVEARDIPYGVVDVVVCDGFTGNVVLKLSEGMAGSLLMMFKQMVNMTLARKLAALILKSGLEEFRQQIDYTEYGGAPLLGLNGICIKAHGSSTAQAIKNAIFQARDCVQQNVAQLIRNEFEKVSEENGW